MWFSKKEVPKDNRVYVILVLDENFIEDFKIFEDAQKAKTLFHKHLRDRGVGLLKRRKAYQNEFYGEEKWQIQLIKTIVK